MTVTISEYSDAILNVVDGIINKDDIVRHKAAKALENLINSGNLPQNLEFLCSFYSALCYDITNNPPSAVRMYRRLNRMHSNNFSYLTLSNVHSQKLALGFAQLGQRDNTSFSNNFLEVVESIRKRETITKQQNDYEFFDDYTVFFSLLNLLHNFFKASENLKIDDLHSIILKASKFHDEISKFELSPWLEILSHLYLELIRKINERSIINLKISDRVKNSLWKSRRHELWLPQISAVNNGLLEGENLVYATPTGSGKSFLAYLSLGNIQKDKQIAYLVPTKSLATQVNDDVNHIFGQSFNIAISDRDRVEEDDHLDEKEFLVATYEKMDALLRRNKIKKENFQTIIIDEVQNIGKKSRGLELELLLTQFRTMEHNQPQIIALSALTSTNDSHDLARWLDAKVVLHKWRPIEVDEAIYFQGKLYHKPPAPEMTSLPPEFLIPKRCNTTEAREHLCAQFTRRAMIENEPILISVPRRIDAPNIANKIRIQLQGSRFLDPDLDDGLRKRQKLQDIAVQTIKEIEAELPPYANELIKLLESGIAYHNAGLPSKYRTAIEIATKQRQIHAIVATSTLEAGINLPFKTVIFYNPKSQHHNRWNYLDTSTYKNIAGRAGRPGYNEKGEAIVLAMSEQEFKTCEKKFWYGDVESISSALNYVVRGDKPAKDIFQSQLLRVAIDKQSITHNDLKEHISSSWFWRTAKPEQKRKLEEIITEEMKKLEEGGFIRMDENTYLPTEYGKKISESMFLPTSAKFIINSLEYMKENDLDNSKLVNFILLLTGIPIEITSRYYNTISDISIPNDILKLESLFKEIDGYDKDRFSLTMKFASALYYWINAVPTQNIIEYCNLNHISYTADIEEGIAKDSQWSLSTISSIADSVEGLDEKITKQIEKVTEYCKLGTSDEIMMELLKRGFEHMGRSTVIQLVNASKRMNKDPYSLTEKEFLKIFPSNPTGAKLLLREFLS